MDIFHSHFFPLHCLLHDPSRTSTSGVPLIMIEPTL